MISREVVVNYQIRSIIHEQYIIIMFTDLNSCKYLIILSYFLRIYYVTIIFISS